MTRAASLFLLAAAVVCAGCIDTLEPGQYGNFRYFGNVNGEVPLSLLPPINDRDGNAYVLFGDINQPGVQLFIGRFGGEWSGDNTCCEGVDTDCELTFPSIPLGLPNLGDPSPFGPHGFVGRAQDRAWYWTDRSLIRARGVVGICSQVLDDDPSGSDLFFRAVVPWVRETPSRTTTLAWIQTRTDPRPFAVVLDLDNNVYTSIDVVGPSNGIYFNVLGVGGDDSEYEGVVVARYTVGEGEGARLYTKAYFYDWEGELIEQVSIKGLDTLPEYGIVGYLHANDTGLYAGLDVEGQLLVLDKSGAERKAISGMNPIGVHKWDGQLYLVGESGGKPRIAHIDDDGDVKKIRTWKSSEEAEDELGSKITVIDDRSLPSREVTWKNPRNATGAHPFLSPHTLDYYAEGTTSWLVAGESYGISGGSSARTQVAYVPVGIAYDE